MFEVRITLIQIIRRFLNFFQIWFLLLLCCWSSTCQALRNPIDEETADSTIILILNNDRNKNGSNIRIRQDYYYDDDDLDYSDENYVEEPVNPVQPAPVNNEQRNPVNQINPALPVYTFTANPRIDPRPTPAKPLPEIRGSSRFDRDSKIWSSSNNNNNNNNNDRNDFFGPPLFPFENFWRQNYENHQHPVQNAFFTNQNSLPSPTSTKTTTSTSTTFKTATTPSFATATSNVRNITSTRINFAQDRLYRGMRSTTSTTATTTTTTTVRPYEFPTTSYPIYVTKPPISSSGFAFPVKTDPESINSVNPFLTSGHMNSEQFYVDPKPDQKIDRFPPEAPICPSTCRCHCDTTPK